MNTLEVTGIKLPTFIGCRSWEKLQRQTVSVDLRLPYKERPFKDEPDNCYEYVALTRNLIQEFESKHHNLIETLAHSIADFIQSQIDVDGIRVSVTKTAVVPWVKSAKYTYVSE